MEQYLEILKIVGPHVVVIFTFVYMIIVIIDFTILEQEKKQLLKQKKELLENIKD